MILIISHFFLFVFLVYFNSLIFLKILKINNKFNFYENCVFGIIFTGLIAPFLNFFFPLNNWIIYINALIIIIFIFQNFNIFKINLKKKDIIIATIVLLISLINIYGSGFSDDLNHYHGGFIGNADHENIIIGFNFLHWHYGYASHWLYLHSYLNFNENFLQDIHILNGIIYFVTLSIFLKEILNNKLSKKNNFNYIILLIFFFIIIKYSRLKEFGIDRPGFLIFFFTIYFCLKYHLLISKVNKNNFFLLCLTILFLISIKIIFIFTAIIPLIIIIYNKNYSLIFFRKNIFLFILTFFYFLKNILISGCFIYPLANSCLNFLSWSSKDIAKNLTFGSEYINKSFAQYKGNLTQELYIQNFNWFPTWFERNRVELIEILLVLILCLLLTLVSSKLIKQKKLNKEITIYTFIFLLILSSYIFLKSPVIRMGHALLIVIGVIIQLTFFHQFKIIFKKNILIILISIGCIYNFGNNFYRITKNKFINNPLEQIKSIGWYQESSMKKIGSFVYYNGWINNYPIGNMDLKNYKYKKIYIFNILYK